MLVKAMQKEQALEITKINEVLNLVINKRQQEINEKETNIEAFLEHKESRSYKTEKEARDQLKQAWLKK